VLAARQFNLIVIGGANFKGELATEQGLGRGRAVAPKPLYLP